VSEESPGTGTVVDLAQASPPRLLFALLHKRFTGTMDVQQPPSDGQPGGPRRVWFGGGMPVFTNWNSGPDVLGQILLEMRLLDEAALMRGLEQMAREGGLLGQVLTQQGSLSNEQLAEALRHQCGRKMTHVFGLRAGQVSLHTGRHELERMAGVNVLELLLAAVGRHYDEARVRAEMGTHLDGQLRTTAAYDRYNEHFRFRPTDAPLLDALQDGTTFPHLSQAGEGGARRAAQLVYVLWAAQMLYTGAAAQTVEARDTPAPRPAPKPAPRAQPAQPARPEPEPEPAPSGPTSADLADFVEKLETFEARISDSTNAFALLGLPLDAGRKDVRANWAILSRRMHPDSLQARGWDHLRERVTDVFAALSEANTLLSNKDARQELAARLARGEDVSASGDADAVNLARAAFESEVVAKDADRYLRANKFQRALAEFERALELTPDEAEYRAAAIWCEYNLSERGRGDAVRAEKALGTVLAESPNLARGQMWRGHILRDMGSSGAAIICYERAIAADPRLIDAERYLRALKRSTGEHPAADGKKGRGLRGLFGKR